MPFTKDGDVEVCKCDENADGGFCCMRGKQPIPHIQCRQYLRQQVETAAKIRSLDKKPNNLKWTVSATVPFVEKW